MSFVPEDIDKESKKEEKKKQKSKNNIPNLQNIQQVEKIELDLESPRFVQAMNNLKITKEDLTKKKNFRLHPDDDKDVVELRRKHHLARLMDTINQVLDERRRISKYYQRIRPKFK